MRVSKKFSTVTLAAAVLALAITSIAQEKQSSFKTKIKNFGCINETFFRGAQPKDQDYKDLATMGVKTIIDLRDDQERNEKQLVENAGMKYVHIGMKDDARPGDEKVQAFLKIANDPASQPIFVHCKGGRHRTGLVTAVYRMEKDGWDVNQAYDEMKKFDFGYGFGHGPLKEYVFGYQVSKNPKGDIGGTVAGEAAKK
jgi:protein tyrosine/serine phosphatase